MKQILRGSALSLAVAALAACGGGAGDAPQSAADQTAVAAAPVDTGAWQGMSGMRDMAGMQGTSGGMMEQMHSHMQMMMGASGDSLMKMMPEHRQMTANMLAQMNREMQGMNAGIDWDAAVNAVRQDLIRIPEMSAAELKAFFPQHQQHVIKLMEMHRSMMGGMKM